MKTSDTNESVRHQRQLSGNNVDMADVYHHVYHDDSSTHGSRTLDSRFSRDRYDLSDEQQTDDDQDETTDKSLVNGLPSSRQSRTSEPFHVDTSEFLHPIERGETQRLTSMLNTKSNSTDRVRSLAASIIIVVVIIVTNPIFYTDVLLR
jgi:hypothetical protein